MSGRKHLFLALSRKGWGETTLGLTVARQVRDAGDTVSFMAHSGSMPALAGSGFEVQEIPDHALPLIQVWLDDCVANDNLSSLVLSDFLTTNYTLTRFGLDPERILDYDLPIIAIDTWQYALTGSTVDVYGAEQWNIGTWIEKVDRRLVPVPIGHPASQGAYRSLPPAASVASSVRRHIRANLGLKNTDRAVLFCTAGWQHDKPDAEGRRIGAAVPKLLWQYLENIGPEVRLIHVGPAPLMLEGAGDRYLWMPAVTPDNFARLVGSVDLFLSLNISATTIGAAIAAGVPVLVVRNSRTVATADDVGSVAANGGSASLRSWLTEALPLFPFAVWPLGFQRFLAPLLAHNPYAGALHVVELLDETAFANIARTLLFDAACREEAVGRQNAYAADVHRLPSAAERFGAYLQ